MVALVEAKAGIALYSDLPKLYRTGRIRSFFQGLSPVEVRIGRNGRRISCSVDPTRPPEIQYIFGAGGSSSLQEIFSRSAHHTMKGTLLRQMLRRDSCGVITVDNSPDHAIIHFRQDLVGEVSQSVQRFVDTIHQLIQRNVISFWVLYESPSPRLDLG